MALRLLLMQATSTRLYRGQLATAAAAPRAMHLVGQYGVHQDTIGRIVRGDIWRYLAGFQGRTESVRTRCRSCRLPGSAS